MTHSHTLYKIAGAIDLLRTGKIDLGVTETDEKLTVHLWNATDSVKKQTSKILDGFEVEFEIEMHQ